MQTIDDTFIAQRQIDHYRGRVAATQGAIVNLCDKPLHDESANTRLQGLCEYMVMYRQRLNYWMEQVESSKPTVQDCAEYLTKHGISFSEIYPVKCGAIAQVEKYGTLDYILPKLQKLGFVAKGEQDYMNDLPYALIQIMGISKG